MNVLCCLKVRFWTMIGSEDSCCSVSDLECQEETSKLKTNIMRAHSYSQGGCNIGTLSVQCSMRV